MSGQQPKASLARTMGGLGALLITLSGLSPSIGVFVVGSDVLRQAGSATWLCFAAAALLGAVIANVYAELAAAFPETGGEYTIVGRVLGPAFGFAMLGLNLLTFSIGPALTALGVAAYLGALIPGLPPVPTAMVLVVLCVGISLLNIRVNAWVTGAFLAVELISLSAVAWLGFSHARRGLAPLLLHPQLLTGAGHMAPASLASLGIGAAAAIYAFDGYGSVVYLGEEVHDAPRRMAKVVFWALGLATAFMLIPMLAVLMGAPDLRALMADPAPLQGFIRTIGGEPLTRAMSLGVALALFNAMIAIALMGGRQLYASGRDGAWPARVSDAFARLHPRFNSPWLATLTLGTTSVLWCLVRQPVLLMILGDGTAAIYGCMCLAALKGRGGASAHAAYRMPAFPWLPWLAFAGLAAVAVADLFDADSRKGLAASAITIALSAGYYLLVLKPRRSWGHRGPGAVVSNPAITINSDSASV